LATLVFAQLISGAEAVPLICVAKL